MARKPLAIAALLLATVATLALLACGGEGKPEEGPISVLDSADNVVTFETPPQRIVALAPSLVEILFVIDAGDRLVAVDENSDFPPAAANLPKLSGFEPNLEAITAFQPDLVLLAFPDPDLQQSLQTLDIPVLLLSTPDTVQGVLDYILILGQVTRQSEKAEELILDLLDRIDAVTAKLADVQQGPSVFHELDPGLFTTCPGEFIHDIYVLLKAQNIATQAGLPCQLSNEAVIAANAEVIILADEPAGVTVESVKARPGWGNIAAVQNDRVYIVDTDIVSRPGPRVVDALEALAKLLYPELFP